MSDVARCRCKLPQGPHGTWLGTEPSDPSRCAIHGPSAPDPALPYRLTYNDRQFLRSVKVAPIDPDDIQQVRQADEDRFKP